MSFFWQDVRYGLRVILKNFGFSSIAVVTLALGIGATTAIFSLVDGILLRPLPYPQPDRLVRVMQSYPEKGLDLWWMSPANFAMYRDQNHVFSTIAAYSNAGVNLTGIERPERLRVTKVTADFFKVFGVDPMFGRTFQPEEDTQGKNTVCVLSYGFWQRHFSEDRSVIGKSLVLDNTATQIIGVMPQGFNFPVPDTEIWLPLGLNAQARRPWFLIGIARLRQGVSAATAQAETTTLLWNAGQQVPELVSRTDPPPRGASLKTLVVPLKDAIVGSTAKSLVVLQSAVVFILLIVCGNVANLLLSRSAVRGREVALRYALGATPKRIVRQLLTESVVLGLLGAIPGVVLAWLLVRGLSSLPVEGIPRIHEVTTSGTVLFFAFVVAILTGLIFGLIPALRTYRAGFNAGLTEGQRGTGSAGGKRLNSALVSVQIALSLILLIGAGLVLKSFQRLLSVNPGFQPEKVLTMLLPVAKDKYPDDAHAFQFYQGLLERLRHLPGVNAVGITSTLPFSGEGNSDGYVTEGQEPGGRDFPQAQLEIVSPGYFQAMGISLLHGRNVSDSDQPNTLQVAVVDDTLARQAWPREEAVGKRIRFTSDLSTWYVVVGVVTGVKDQNLADPLKPHVYFSHGQGSQLRMFLVVRTSSEPADMASSVRAAIQNLDPDVPVYGIRTLTQVVDHTLNGQKLTRLLMTAFAILALVLAAIGVYGVASVYVTNRTREFGIRMAVGARPSNVLFSVLKQGLVLAAAGVAVGLLAAIGLTQAISSLLYEVSPMDPVAFTAVPLLLVIVAVIACYWPARRAAKTNPSSALRQE